jgi:hypothetical protein
MAGRARSQTLSVQEGSRWLHEPPSGPDFASWFKENVKIHDDLEHEDYINGITLIPNVETIKVTDEDGEITEKRRLVFSPYPQVETRVRYFWDWCAANGYFGEISIVPPVKQSPMLPPGIFQMVVKQNERDHAWLGAKAQVRVYERDIRAGGKGRLLISPPPATKTVPLSTGRGPDVNAPLKAETGAIGRALGFAGMLVIPGAGISTAEDMQELTSAGPAGGTTIAGVGLPEHEQEPPAPQAEAPVQDLAATVNELAATLQSEHPDAWAQVEAWAQERSLSLDDPPPASLRFLERQLRRKLEAAA